MKIRLLRDLNVMEIEADELIISDEFGDPLVVAIRLDERAHLLTKRGDDDFNQTLDMLGLPRVRTDIVQGPRDPRLLLPP